MLEGERTGKHNIVVVPSAHEALRKGDESPVVNASPELLHANRYRFKFTRKGEYSYICPTHPYMKGKITVY